MKSKFSPRIALCIILLVFAIGILVMITIAIIWQLPDEWMPFIVFYILFLFIAIWLFFGEMRLRMITVEITNDYLEVASFLGLGKKKIFWFYELDGYETALLPSKYNTYEYLFILHNGKRVARLSAFYHRNYTELKAPLTKKLKNLGSYGFRVIKELKDIFG